MATDDFSYQGLRSELLYDPDTGLFRKIIINTIAFYKDKPVGAVQKNGYVSIALLGKPYKAHRLAWFYMHGKWPKNGIDHIDGNKSNNAIVNLREATPGQNSQNQRASHKGSASGLLGVYPAPFDKWLSRISIKGKAMYLGHFKTPEEAHAAYVKAKRKHHNFCTI